MYNIKDLFLVELRIFDGNYSQSAALYICTKSGNKWTNVMNGVIMNNSSNNMLIGYTKPLKDFVKRDKNKIDVLELKLILEDINGERVYW